MGSFRVHSPTIAVALICVCSAASVLLVSFNTVLTLTREDDNPADRLIAKYETLRSLLPAGVPVRFVLDEAHLNQGWTANWDRMYLARYAAAPVWLSSSTETQWVVVDSDAPDIEPEIAKENGWTPVADWGNGLRLYRTHGEKK